MTKDEQIVALHRQELSQRAIARAVGVSQPAVRKRLLKLGLITPVPKQPGDNHRLPDNHPTADSPAAASQDNSPEAQPAAKCETPGLSDNHPHPAEAREPQPHPQGDNLSRIAIPPGAIRCGFCGEAFLPQRADPKFCCNSCAYRHQGLQISIQGHSKDCRLPSLSTG